MVPLRPVWRDTKVWVGWLLLVLGRIDPHPHVANPPASSNVSAFLKNYAQPVRHAHPLAWRRELKQAGLGIQKSLG